ncbi:MAG TPA: hypothetical protein VF794_17800 [Archangium sp.]|jgi:hypothetical protein|uniref:hypothetical protein n=1 Tax=Archangium sp. TaxID=1872627 RepID=UPI002EDA42D2
MPKALTASVGRFDKAFVAWVALALALMLPVLQWRSLVHLEGIHEDGRGAASRSLSQHDQEDQPSSPCEESCSQLLESFEDEAVPHHKHAFVLAELSLKFTPVLQFEPDSLHTRELDRPPLRTA